MPELLPVLLGALALAAFLSVSAAIITCLDRPTGREAWVALWSCAAWPYYLPRHIWRVHQARATWQGTPDPYPARQADRPKESR